MCARVNIDDQSKILVVGSRDLKGEWTTATAETIRCKMVAIRKYSNLKYFMVRFLQKKTTQICFFSLFKLKINSFFFSFQGSDRHVLILRSANNIRIMDLMEELQPRGKKRDSLYSRSTVGVPLEYRWSTVGVPLEYGWSTAGVPLEYGWSTKWSTSGVPLEYEWSTSGVRVEYESRFFPLDYNS